MKCIQCGTDNNLKDRTEHQGRCKNCNHPFAFEPTSMEGIKLTDPFFAKAIADISVNHTLFFTTDQLLYLLDRRLKRRAHTSGTSFLIVVYLFFSGGILSSVYWFCFGGILSFFILPITTIFGLAFVIGWSGWNLFCIYCLFNRSNSQTSSHADRRSSTTLLQVLGGFVLIASFVASILIQFPVYAFAIPISFMALGLGIWQRSKLAEIPETLLIKKSQLQGWLEKWEQANGSITHLLRSSQTDALPETQENAADSDVTAYSFDRLIVCDRVAIAQLLIANNFHFENNCAILSISGYPRNLFSTIMQMVRQNPDLKVFALHDCSPNGIRLVHQLRTSPDWFSSSDVAIVDIGLLPRQIITSKRYISFQSSENSARTAKALPSAIRKSLSEVELQWLEAGNLVKLEAFPPQKLIQILQSAIALTQEMTVADSSLLLISDYGSSGYIYATESFG